MILPDRCSHAGGSSADGHLTGRFNHTTRRTARCPLVTCNRAANGSGVRHDLQQVHCGQSPGAYYAAAPHSEQPQVQTSILLPPQQPSDLSLQADTSQARHHLDGSLEDLLAVADFKAQQIPDPAWIAAWGKAVISCLPAVEPSSLLKLLVLLSELPTSVMQQLNRTHSFESALWTACARCYVAQPESSSSVVSITGAAEVADKSSTNTIVLCVDALKAAGKLRQRHGMHPSDSWTQPLISDLASYIHSSCSDANSHSQEVQAYTQDVGMLATKTLQAVHQLSQLLPAETAERLLVAVIHLLPQLDTVQAAKVLSALPGLVKYAPTQIPRLYMTMLSTLMKQLSIPLHKSAHTSPSQEASELTDNHTCSQQQTLSTGQCRVEDSNAATTPSTEPLCERQLANWLHALTSKPFSTVHHDRHGSSQYRDKIDHMWRILKPRILLAATPGMLASSSPQDVLNIMLGMARLHIRPSQDWVEGVLPVLHPRLFSQLQPRQFMLLTWAAAHLKLGTAVSPAWLQQLLSTSLGFMRHVDAPLRAQFAWSVSELARQQQPTANSIPDPQTSTAAAGSPAGDQSDAEGAIQWHVPIPWLQQLMLSSQASFRHSDAGSLASLTCSIAQLVQPVLIATNSSSSSRDESNQVSVQRTALLSLLLRWTEDVCAAFMRRVPMADARALSSMLDGLSQIVAIVKQAQDWSAEVSGWLHRNDSSLTDLYTAGLGQISEMAKQHQHRVHLKDLSVTLTAVARMHTAVSLQLPTNHIQHLISVASSMTLAKQPSAETATDLASIMLALPALPMASRPSSNSNSNGQDSSSHSALHVRPTVIRPCSVLPDSNLHAALLCHLPVAHAHSVAAVWLALVRLGFRPDAELAQMLLLSSHRRMQAMQPKHMAHMLHAMAAFGIKPNEKWLDRMQLAVFQLHQQKQLLPRQRAMVLWASAKAGWPLHGEFTMALAPSARWIQHMHLHDIAMAAWSVCKLGVRPGTPWLMVALMQTATQMAIVNNQARDYSAQSDLTNIRHLSVGEARMHGQGDNSIMMHGNWVSGHPPLGNKMRELLMLADTFGRWGVSAPHWWWTAWLTSIQAAEHCLDLYACSYVLRVIARHRPYLLTTAAHHNDVAVALQQAQKTIVARVSKLLLQMDTLKPHAVATLLWAAARFVHIDARVDPRPPSDLSLLGCNSFHQMLKSLVHVWPSGSASAQPGYVLMVAGAVCRLAKHGCIAFATASAATAVPQLHSINAPNQHEGGGSSSSKGSQSPTSGIGDQGSQPMHAPVLIPDAWRRELVCMLEGRQASLDTGQQHQAAVMLQFLEDFNL